MVLVLLGQEPGQGCEDGPVWPGGTRSGDLSAQHHDFMSQHEQLGVLGRLSASKQCKPVEELTQDQVQESECHGWRSSRASSTDAKPHVNVMDEVSGTHNLRYGLSYRDVEELLTERGINVEADHGRLKARLRPMRGLKRMRSARTIAEGHAFVQNLRRGHYELTVDESVCDRVRAAFSELAHCL